MKPPGFALCALYVLLLASPTLSSPSTSWKPTDLPSPQNDPTNVCGRHGKKSSVCSPDGLLSPSDADTLDGLINFIEDGTNGFEKAQCGSHLAGYQVAVAIVTRMHVSMFSDASNAASDFARALHDSWGVGDPACQNGVVVFVSVADRVMHISTGRGAKKMLTDARVQRILQLMKKPMREEQYGKALIACVNQIGLVVSGLGQVYESSEGPGFFWMLVMGAFFACTCCSGLSSSRRRRRKFSQCKAALERIDRDTKKARENKYEAKSCPICLEDFAPAGDASEKSSRAPAEPEAAAGENGESVTARLLTDGDETSNRVITLRCGHMFHAHCIASWAAGSSANRGLCPVCRKPVEGEAEEDAPLRSDLAGFDDERRFRIRRTHYFYPDFVTQDMMYRWQADRNLELGENREFLNMRLVTAEAARASGAEGSSFSFGGGDSCGGGGGGASF